MSEQHQTPERIWLVYVSDCPGWAWVALPNPDDCDPAPEAVEYVRAAGLRAELFDVLPDGGAFVRLRSGDAIVATLPVRHPFVFARMEHVKGKRPQSHGAAGDWSVRLCTDERALVAERDALAETAARLRAAEAENERLKAELQRACELTEDLRDALGFGGAR